MGEYREVDVERTGAVWVVSIDRPARRNAVDNAAATAMVEAFEAFDADPDASVAVLTGRHGVFCAGADLQALAGGERRPVDTTGPGPMGPTRMRLDKPVIAAIEGYAVAGGWSLPCGVTCAWRPRAPRSVCTVGGSAYRSSTSVPSGCHG